VLIQRLVEALRLEQLRDPLAWLDIVLLAFVIYQVLLMIRRTRAVQVSYGLLLLLVLWFVTDPSGLVPLKAVHEVLGTLLFYLPFVVIVLFQSSIKQALARFGALSFLPLRQPEVVGDPAILEVALAASSMASTRTGALIVFERVQGLKSYADTGIALDAAVSYDLLVNIFTPRTPLHDGAVIIGEGRIQAASAFLPLSTDPFISRTFGTRHRAALGISSETDAVAVVVSEERGMVSIAVDGRLEQDLDTRRLRERLAQLLSPERGRARRRRAAARLAAAREGAARAAASRRTAS
jgi:diadenylate cyclase